MSIGYNLAHLVAAAVVLAAVIGWLRWPRLDRGGRWLVGGVTVSAAFLPLMLALLLAGRSNRLVHEFEMLLETVAMVIAFGWWQPDSRRQQRAWWLLGLFLVLWVGAQAIQGLDSDFSYVSAPIAGLVKVGAAGYTLVGRVQAARGRWTDNLWFWAAVGIMVIYGTGVILDPVWFQVFRARDDLVVTAFVIYVAGNVLGYLLIARGLWRLPRVGVAPDAV